MNPDTLVTGASGLLGSHLVNLLARQGKQVRALYSSTQPTINSKDNSNIEWMQVDILDVVSLQEAMQDIKQVYHCAGKVSFHSKEKKALYNVNVQGTANVVNACLEANIDKMLFVSSVAAIGKNSKDMIDETMQWTNSTNNSEYGKSKYFAEMEVWRGISEGLKAVIVNPSIILGASDWNKGSTALFKSAYDEFAWYTEGITGFVDVNDVVNAMILLMNSEITAERFILSSENISFKELFTLIANGFGKKPPRKKVSPLLAEIVWRAEYLKAILTGKAPLLTKETAYAAQAKVYFDNSKIKRLLPGFTFTPIKDSVQHICEKMNEKSGIRN